MNEYPDDLGGTYSCEVIEPGTEGTVIIPTRKENNNEQETDEEPEIDVVGTPREERTEEYVEPSLPNNWYHTVELLHSNPPSNNTPADEIEKEKIEEIDLTRNEGKERPNKRTNTQRAQETLSELDRLIKQEYEVIKNKEGTPEYIAKCTIMR